MTTRAERRHPDRHYAQAAVFSTLSAGVWAASFGESVANFMRADAMRVDPWVCRPEGGTLMAQSGPRIAETRTKIVQTFLDAEPFARAQWLVMVDSDMVFSHDDLHDLLERADPDERPILGGLCFAGQSPDTMYPTIYRCFRPYPDAPLDITHVRDYPVDQLVSCDATGGAFMVVHRKVLADMRERFAGPYPWFVEGHQDKHNRPVGEDIAFCLRARALDYPVHVDTRIKIGHVKQVVLNEGMFTP